MLTIYEIKNSSGKRKTRICKNYHCLDHDRLLTVTRTFQVPESIGYEKFKLMSREEREAFTMQLTPVEDNREFPKHKIKRRIYGR